MNPNIADETFQTPLIFKARGAAWQPYLAQIDTNASHPATWDFLATLAAMPHVKTIVEAGTYRGHGTFAMAEALLLSQSDATIWTADVENHGVMEVVDAMGLSKHVRFCHGRFDLLLSILTTPIDLAFIDASELERPLLRLEYVNAVMAKMAPHGLVVVDDSTDDEWEGAKMLREHANLYLPIGHGLTIFQGVRT